MFVSKARSHAFHVACCCSVSYVWPYVQRVGVLVQRTSTDVHNWITFSINPLVLAQSKTAHLYLMTSNPIWPNSDRAVLLLWPRWSNFKRVLCLAPIMWHSRLTTIFSAPEEIQQACNKSRNYTIENTEYVNTRVLIGNTFAALQPREGSLQ